MKRYKILITSVLTIICVLSGCDIDSDNNKVCTYNARIENSYILPEDEGRILNIRDYVFDAEGVLLNVSDRNKDALQYKEIQLNEGDYTLVSWANLGKASQTNTEEVGKTHLSDMLLSVDAPSMYSGYSQNCEKLYFGTVKFSVGQTGISHSTLLMRRAYASLKMTVKWTQDEQRPENQDKFNLRLTNVCSEYVFGNPFLQTNSDNTAYTAPATMNEAGEIIGELVSYRYSNKTHQLIRLYNGNTPLTGELDLTPLFEKLNLDLDAATRQDFKGSIEINGSKILIILNEELQSLN